MLARSIYIHRLYCKGRILGHKRGKRNSRPNQSLVQIEGVDTKENARAYLGKVSLFCWSEEGWGWAVSSLVKSAGMERSDVLEG